MQIEAKKILGNMLNGFCIFITSLTLIQSQTRNHSLRGLGDVTLGQRLFVRIDHVHEYRIMYIKATLAWGMSTCINQTGVPSMASCAAILSRVQFVANLLPVSQACIPLSYTAQIATTSNPDLANVRVSLTNLERGVLKRGVSVNSCSVHLCVCISLSDYVSLFVCLSV